MTAQTLDGELVATAIKADLSRRIAVLADRGVTPGLGTLLVGDDGPSANYVAMKHRDCAELGIASRQVHLPASATAADIAQVVDDYNTDPAIDAVLMQYPFPAGLDYEAALLRLDPAKDADGLHPVNLGRLVMGVDAPRACTPAGIQALLAHYDIPIAGRHVVIVGRGLTIGRPLANLLSLKAPHANAAVTVVHTGITDLGTYTREADILVAAAGAPGIITPDLVRPGAVVVAAGVRYEGRTVLSDVVDEVAEVAGWLSPRIGGVGPMTRAMLLRNAVRAAERAS
ncbi:MAG TPA: tetrahydrofolate dehydrogenase/cyclohydrolase catalytic domain-containing protein [Acidimicrobiales bacterium]